MGNSIFDSPKLIDIICRPRDVPTADVTKTSVGHGKPTLSADDYKESCPETDVSHNDMTPGIETLATAAVAVEPGGRPDAYVAPSSTHPVSSHGEKVVNKVLDGRKCDGIQPTNGRSAMDKAFKITTDADNNDQN